MCSNLFLKTVTSNFNTINGAIFGLLYVQIQAE